MAAIAGAISLAGAPPGACAEAIIARMRHRASGAEATSWSRDGAALAHRASWAGQASSGRQPVELADGAVLVVDGRIDDRPTLLAARGGARTDASDAALFGRAWERWRERLWRHVVGDYAIAVWEPRTRVLTLMRDRVGVRPLYWACDRGWFTFASESQALLAAPGATGAVNHDVIAAILAPPFQVDDPTRTVYDEVRRVLPGCVLEVRPGGRHTARAYWTFDDMPEAPVRVGDECVEAFRAVFDEAVRCRVDADACAALMLSGGIDSASIHASALHRGLPLRRVVVDAEQWNADGERRNIRTMLAQSAEATCLAIPGAEASVDIRRLVEELFVRAHPVLASLCLPMLVGQCAAARGSRVMLDGVDGDLALHAPTHYLAPLLRRGHWRRAAVEARLAAQHHTYLRHLPPWRIAAGALAANAQPAWLGKLRDRVASARAGDRAFGSLQHPDLLRSLRLRERTLQGRLASRDAHGPDDWRDVRTGLWRGHGFMSGMEGFDLAAARWGMESRHPWADMRVLALVARMPLECLVQGGWTKHVARTAYAHELGDVAWHSGKAHLGPQVAKALLRAGRSHVDHALQDEDGVLAGIVDPRALHAARTQWTHAPDGAAVAVDTLMTMTVLHGWLRATQAQVAGSSPAPAPTLPAGGELTG
jgi:asparagine synthase (glutamine-hydrolysing)